MKLAEALSLRADLQKRIEQMRSRLEAATLVQEGDVPPEDPKELMRELNEMLSQLQTLIVGINRTNQSCLTSDGTRIADKIAERDVLKMKSEKLHDLLSYLQARPGRGSRNEIKYVCVIDIKNLRKEADKCSQQLRLVDVDIQAANWQVDLINS